MKRGATNYTPQSPDVEDEEQFQGGAAPEMEDDELACEGCGAPTGVPCECYEAKPSGYKVNLADDPDLLDAGPDLGEYLGMWILSDAQKVQPSVLSNPLTLKRLLCAGPMRPI